MMQERIDYTIEDAIKICNENHIDEPMAPEGLDPRDIAEVKPIVRDFKRRYPTLGVTEQEAYHYRMFKIRKIYAVQKKGRHAYKSQVRKAAEFSSPYFFTKTK